MTFVLDVPKIEMSPESLMKLSGLTCTYVFGGHFIQWRTLLAYFNVNRRTFAEKGLASKVIFLLTFTSLSTGLTGWAS